MHPANCSNEQAQNEKEKNVHSEVVLDRLMKIMIQLGVRQFLQFHPVRDECSKLILVFQSLVANDFLINY